MIQTMYHVHAQPPRDQGLSPAELYTPDERKAKQFIDAFKEKSWQVKSDHGRIDWYDYKHLSREEY